MRSGIPFRLVLSAAALMGAVLVSTYLLRSPDIALSTGTRLAVALTPVPLAIWLIAEYVRLMRAADEFVRRVMLEALAIGYPAALVIGMTVEYLQKGGFLLGADVGRVWPLQGLIWVVAYAYARWRYR